MIRMAKTTNELNDILELRFRLAKESGVMVGRREQFTERLIDHLDVYPNTINLIAYRSGKAIAALRVVECRASEPLTHLVFDYRETLANLKTKAYLLDMMVVTGFGEWQSYLALQMIKTALGLLANRGITRCLITAPERLQLQERLTGFTPITNAVESELLRTVVQPAVIDIEQYYEAFLNGIADREILRFQDAFYISLFEPGEILVAQGEKGTTAYLVEDGEVEVLIRDANNSVIPVSVITRGNLIGEVAMITQEPRTASLIARRSTSCVSFDRPEFLKLMYDEPHRSLDIFRIFSKRLNESNRRLAEARSQK